MSNTCISELLSGVVWASTHLLGHISEVWGDWDEAQAHSIKVRERILNHLAKLGILAIWLSLHLRTERLWVRFRFQLLGRLSKLSSSSGMRNYSPIYSPKQDPMFFLKPCLPISIKRYCNNNTTLQLELSLKWGDNCTFFSPPPALY